MQPDPPSSDSRRSKRPRPGKPKGASMREIAKQANVALSTVSVVLNHTQDVPVSDATRQMVLRVALELGYTRHSLARAIKSPLRQIGIAVGDTREACESFTSIIFQGVAQHVLGSGYYPILLPVGQYESETKADLTQVPARVIELFQSRLIDGLVLDKPSFLNKEVCAIVDAGIPTVVVNTGLGLCDSAGRLIPTVTINDRLGGRIAAQHLLALGHARIALVMRSFTQGPRANYSMPVNELRLGYEAALKQEKVAVDPRLVVEGDVIEPDLTYAAVNKIMQLPSGMRPTAIIVGDSQMAIMVMNGLRRMGLSIPQDVSLVAYGDIDVVSRLSEPRLTIVEAPFLENGRLAAANLLTLLDHCRNRTSSGPSPLDPVAPILDPRLSPGATTAPPPGP